MKRTVILSTYIALLLGSAFTACNSDKTSTAEPKAEAKLESDVELKMPEGFSATVFAQSLHSPRHLAVDSNGDVYVKLGGANNGNGIMRLRDTNGDGQADDSLGFGDFGGDGIGIANGYLYASSNEEVFRYKLNGNHSVENPGNPEKIVTGLIARNQHEGKAFALDNAGNIYVNIGAYSNACQEKDRSKGSPGMQPCPILDSAGGIWQFKTDKMNQQYGDGVRYATGLRNCVALDWNKTTNSLFVMQHGRDQLHEFFPDLYTEEQSAVLPAECLYELHQGSDCGWPYMYYDQQQQKKLQMPEYGGDGKKEADSKYQDPLYGFPGHLAPDGLLFYTGTQFPEKYRNGAFIAFHGSWNRAPEPQAGYFVAFLPFANGKPSGEWEIFADNFSGGPELTASGAAKHRPCGLAMTSDGSLLVTDDKNGTIWQISYKK